MFYFCDRFLFKWQCIYSSFKKGCKALNKECERGSIYHYKITKIVCVLWLAERHVCMRVCKHGCDIKMFCFSRANHASTNLKKVLSWKTRQVYFIYPFPRRLKLGKSLETCCVNFFRLSWHFKREKTRILKSIFFAKQGLITRIGFVYKTWRSTGKNLSFNQCSKQESFAFFLGKVIL